MEAYTAAEIAAREQKERNDDESFESLTDVEADDEKMVCLN